MFHYIVPSTIYFIMEKYFSVSAAPPNNIDNFLDLLRKNWTFKNFNENFCVLHLPVHSFVF